MKTIKIVCLAVIAFIIASSFPVLAQNDNISKKQSNEQITFGDKSNEYKEYSKSIEDVDYIKNDIVLSNPSSSSDNFRIEDNVIILKEGKTSFDFYADNDSKFIINLDYKVVNEDFMDANIGVSIDDSYSFLDCESIDVKRYWVDSGKMRKDDLGNEFAAEQVP
ncbi:MAG: hypothetical protein MJ231_08950, partial [bacterium]|nr:hypothetical protein [bacterium]